MYLHLLVYFQIMLNSLHKYQPRIHIVRVGNGEKKSIATYTFESTQFVAVTAYQNEEVSQWQIGLEYPEFLWTLIQSYLIFPMHPKHPILW